MIDKFDRQPKAARTVLRNYHQFQLSPSRWFILDTLEKGLHNGGKMPGRKTVLATGEVYHLFNRGIEHRPIFSSKRDYRRFVQTLIFYRFASPPLKLSRFLVLSRKKRDKFFERLNQDGKKLVEIICYCLMPNHFHFLLRQSKEEGISKYMSQIQNSYTKYFNTSRHRIGSLFQGHFKAVRVETNEQLLHLSRYIHLNPYSSFVVKNSVVLKSYPWSSFPEYLDGTNKNFLFKDIVLNSFKDKKDYQKFVLNQADYQRELERIRHLTWDEG